MPGYLDSEDGLDVVGAASFLASRVEELELLDDELGESPAEDLRA
jgi:hypothetical protein